MMIDDYLRIFAVCFTAVSIWAAVALGAAAVYLARHGTPAKRAVLRDIAGLVFSLAAFLAGALLGYYVMTTNGIPAIGWIAIPALAVLSICLFLGGIIGSVVVFRRNRSFAQKADAEDYLSNS